MSITVKQMPTDLVCGYRGLGPRQCGSNVIHFNTAFPSLDISCVSGVPFLYSEANPTGPISKPHPAWTSLHPLCILAFVQTFPELWNKQ